MSMPSPMGGLPRRDFLRLAAAGISGMSCSGWMQALAAEAEQRQLKHKACIVLFMDGGPPHRDTFDLKPGAPEGIFKPIATAVPGIQISELLPKFATIMQQAAIVRSMQTIEAEHGRARYHLRTGRQSGQGGVAHPSLGAIASAEIGEPNFPVPNYISIAETILPGHGAGFLGMRHDPLQVRDPAAGVDNLKAQVDDKQFASRVGLLESMDRSFSRAFQSPLGGDHNTVYRRAVQLMHTEKAKAFNLAAEPASTRALYGEGKFAQSCILARRLVEVGVKFVEVVLPGWDTHDENNETIKKLCSALDQPMTALVTDLKDRGMLDSTLVVWMGEFGRTPYFKGKGRDHFPRAWSTAFMGGGTRGGQVIGKTDDKGAAVVDSPVSVLDFMATICHILGIDYTKQNQAPNGRPLSIVDKGANPIKELIS